MQSSYFRTTETNQEFRRGFAEFAIPQLGVQIRRATLTFAEGPGVTLPGNPAPVEHELSWYAADLKVSVEDYNRPTAMLAHFEDDLTDPNSVWSFDITDVVLEAEGRCLGFRMNLVVDPGYEAYDTLGTSFGRYIWQPPEIRLGLA